MNNEDLLNLLAEPWTLLVKQRSNKKYDLIIGLGTSIEELEPMVKNLDFEAMNLFINQLSFLMVFCEARGVYEATKKLADVKIATEAYLQAMQAGFARVEKEINSMNNDPH